MQKLLIPAALFLPFFASAKTLKELVNEDIVPLGDTIISLFFALAFVFFLIGVARYFFSGQDEESRDKGKQFALWGLIGLVVMFSVWGFVKLLLSILPGTAG